MPLHTVMELTPKADGTMAETRFIVDVDKVGLGWSRAQVKSGEPGPGGEPGERVAGRQWVSWCFWRQSGSGRRALSC